MQGARRGTNKIVFFEIMPDVSKTNLQWKTTSTTKMQTLELLLVTHFIEFLIENKKK